MNLVFSISVKLPFSISTICASYSSPFEHDAGACEPESDSQLERGIKTDCVQDG
tara:strand:- start:1384 stop:1545 length:162 start_codon:yes stop_codon:yes gene_type:complete